MNVEWDIPFTLTSPYGTFDFNAQESESGMWFVLDPTKCQVFHGIRQTTDPIPQANGSIVHREYTDGYSIRMGGWIMEQPTDGIAACGADLRGAWDALQKHLHALLGGDVALNGDNSRIQWTPTDYGQDRLLGDLRLFEELTPTHDPGGGPIEFSFALHSPFPYAIDETEHTDAIDVTIDNPGNCLVYPNIKVYGPVAAFTINNLTTGQVFNYDDSQPGAVAIGGGDYAFLGHFANNIYLNGDQVNLMAGVVIDESEFFGLIPGENIITIDTTTADLIWNAGWV